MLGLAPEKTFGDFYQNVCGGKKKSPTEPEKNLGIRSTQTCLLSFSEKEGNSRALEMLPIFSHTPPEMGTCQTLSINTQTLL